MTESEATEYRDAISNVLLKHRMGWVLEQANEKILLGKLQSKRVDASVKEIDVVAQSLRAPSRKSMTEFYFTANYSESEKLTILIEAIDLALISTAQMENMFFENVQSDMQVSFMSDEGAPEFKHEMRVKDDSRRNAFVKTLKEAITAIRALY